MKSQHAPEQCKTDRRGKNEKRVKQRRKKRIGLRRTAEMTEIKCERNSYKKMQRVKESYYHWCDADINA